MPSFVDEYRTLLRQNKICQREVARYLGVSNPCVSVYLKKSSNLTEKKMRMLADAVGCELEIRFVPKKQLS